MDVDPRDVLTRTQLDDLARQRSKLAAVRRHEASIDRRLFEAYAVTADWLTYHDAVRTAPGGHSDPTLATICTDESLIEELTNVALWLAEAVKALDNTDRAVERLANRGKAPAHTALPAVGECERCGRYCAGEGIENSGGRLVRGLCSKACYPAWYRAGKPATKLVPLNPKPTGLDVPTSAAVSRTSMEQVRYYMTWDGDDYRRET